MDDTETSGEAVLAWARFLCFAVAVAVLSVAAGLRWSVQVVSAIFQAIGVLLTLFGLAAIGDRLRQVAESAAAAIGQTRRRSGEWLHRRREQLAHWWARIRRRPRPVIIRAGTATATASAGGDLSVSTTRNRVDRSTVSDRDWLAYLDDRLESVFELLDQAEQRRSAEREDFNRRLGVQRRELRAEIVRETRQGWQLVFWGLMSTLVGVVLGAFA